MPVLFNFDQIEPTVVTTGVTRQALITKERVNSDFIQLDRLILQPGISTALEVSKTDLSWFQLLQGTATLNSSEKSHELMTFTQLYYKTISNDMLTLRWITEHILFADNGCTIQQDRIYHAYPKTPL